MEKHNLRQVYVETLIRFARQDPRIVSLDTDSREATLSDRFAAEFPERSFSFGIAEQDMVSAAGGMATMGLIPFVNSYAMFIAMRALDQVRNAVAYPNLNVKFVLSHHGLDVGSDGVTHQLTEDVAIFRTIPNLQLLHPADSTEMRQMVEYAIQIHGPIIIKSGKSAVPMVMPADYVWRYGEPALVADGEKIAIIANGVMVHRALTARSIVQKQANFSPRVINLSSLTDVNADTLLQLTDGVSHVVTVEDHSIYGGLGGIISEILSEHRPSHVVRMGMGRTFAQAGTPDELFARYGLDAAAIARNAIALTQP